MYQYYILEIQKNDQGEYGHIVHWAYDEDPVKARLKAESQYYTIVAAAALSTLPQHAVTLLASDGILILNHCYKHGEEEVTPNEI